MNTEEYGQHESLGDEGKVSTNSDFWIGDSDCDREMVECFLRR